MGIEDNKKFIYYNFNMDLADFKERLLKHPLPGGTDNFKILMDSGRYYVDKTLFVQDIMNYSYDSVLFTRPRRFGKTLNMSMLQTFFEKPIDGKDTSHYFKNLKIWKCGEKYTSEQGLSSCFLCKCRQYLKAIKQNEQQRQNFI